MVTSKREIIAKVAKATGKYQSEVREIIQKALDQIIDELAGGRRVEFREFGIFEPSYKRARKARNPKTGETVHLPDRVVVQFKTGNVMKEKVGKLVAKQKGAQQPAEAALRK